MSPKHALAVQCPTCLARRGEPCLNLKLTGPRDVVAKTAHSQRVEASRRIAKNRMGSRWLGRVS